MNEHLAKENAALIGELAKLQRKQRNQAAEQGRQQQFPESVVGIPRDKFARLLSAPGAEAAEVAEASAASLSSADGDNSSHTNRLAKTGNPGEEPNSSISSSGFADDWDSMHSALRQRTQLLETQFELTRLRAECEMLKAATSEAAAQAETKQGLVATLQRQLADATTQHQREVRELKKAAKQVERRSEELSQQLPKKADDSTLQVKWFVPKGTDFDSDCMACSRSMITAT